MFIVPIHVSPRNLFGGSEFVNGMPITRIGAGQDCDSPFHGKIQKELIEEGFGLEPFKKIRPVREEINLCSNVLFYRRFLCRQQPCGVCERPLNVLEFNAILPCAHIVHICKVVTRKKCSIVVLVHDV